MNDRVLLLLNDAQASRKFKKLLNLLDYENVEIMSCDNPDFDSLFSGSPELVIIGSSFFEKKGSVPFIQKAVLLELPVIIFSSSAEVFFHKSTLEKVLSKLSPALRPLHKYLLQEIFQDNGIHEESTHVSDEVLISLQKDGNALYLLKQLKCLYFISDVMNMPDLSIEAVLKHTLLSIEKALSYGDDASVRITYLNTVYESDKFMESRLKIESPVFVNSRELGEIEVFYHKHSMDREYLLKMENDLINAISERIGHYIQGQDVIAELKKTNLELRNLSSHLQDVREGERKMVASTIHDEFGQRLLTLRFELLNLKRKVQEGGTDIIHNIDDMLGLLEGSINTVRNISSNLRPGVLDKLGIAAAIQWLAQDTESRTGIRFNVICSPEDLVLNDDYTTALFRIFQEATTNIVRHSCASEIIVNLKATENEVMLIVLDDGKGISPEDVNRADSFGIKGMRERVLSFQGSFSISSNGDRGTLLKVSLPLLAG